LGNILKRRFLLAAKNMALKKKTRIFLWRAALVTAILIMIGFMAYYKFVIEPETRAKAMRYAAFGIDMPRGYRIHGIDVSAFQRSIYWPGVKSMQVDSIRMGFVFIKATEGLNDKDNQFKRNLQKAREAGMACGAYHFFLATKSGKDQARHFIKHVKLQKGDLPPVLDIENLYGVKPDLMTARAKEWLAVVEAHYGVRPIIYSNANFYERYLAAGFAQYPLWVAHYLEPEAPRVSRPWTFWQHSELGKVNGIMPYVDCNVFNGDSAQWRSLLIK
jgi:lysozyme